MARHAFKKTVEIVVPALGTDVEGTYPIWKATFDGSLESAEYIAVAAITGVATNNRKLALVNKGQAGAGTTEMAEKTFANGVNAVAFDNTALTNSATPANLDFVEGDVIALASTAPGTGLADPGGMIRAVFAREVAD